MEILLIIVVIGLLFGAKKLPQLAKGLGASLSSFKKGKLEAERELKEIENSFRDVGKDVADAAKEAVK